MKFFDFVSSMSLMKEHRRRNTNYYFSLEYEGRTYEFPSEFQWLCSHIVKREKLVVTKIIVCQDGVKRIESKYANDFEGINQERQEQLSSLHDRHKVFRSLSSFWLRFETFEEITKHNTHCTPCQILLLSLQNEWHEAPQYMFEQ
jgi:hypothetical protein